MSLQGESENQTLPQPLVGLRVIEIGSAVCAYCSRILADLGADVIKIEPPTGDAMRKRPPFLRIGGGGNTSLLFATYHANKRGITLETRVDEALPLLHELGATADVVVLSPTGQQQVAGFDREALSLAWAHDRTVVAAVTPFGLTGPMRDWRSTPYLSYAIGGGMHRAGHAGSPPLAVPGQQQWDEAGVYAALGILSALRVRDEIGGQLLDLAVHEVATAKDFFIERYDLDGMGGEWGRNVTVGFPPTGTWRCTDGDLDIACYQVHHWAAFLKMLDNPAELSDPDLSNPMVRRARFEQLTDIIAKLLADRSRLELFAKGQSCGLPCNPANSPSAFVADEQAVARNLFVPVTLDGLGEVRLPWGGFKSSPPMLRLRQGAPSLGQHNEEVYVSELRHSSAELRAWKESGVV